METKKCPRCGGMGVIPHFFHVEAGICFLCRGRKVVGVKAEKAPHAAPRRQERQGRFEQLVRDVVEVRGERPGAPSLFAQRAGRSNRPSRQAQQATQGAQQATQPLTFRTFTVSGIRVYTRLPRLAGGQAAGGARPKGELRIGRSGAWFAADALTCDGLALLHGGDVLLRALTDEDERALAAACEAIGVYDLLPF